MNGKRLYAEILGIVSPWDVKDVQVDLDGSQIEIIVDYIKGTAPCAVPRVPCPEHGGKTAGVPWAEDFDASKTFVSSSFFTSENLTSTHTKVGGSRIFSQNLAHSTKR